MQSDGRDGSSRTKIGGESDVTLDVALDVD